MPITEPDRDATRAVIEAARRLAEEFRDVAMIEISQLEGDGQPPGDDWRYHLRDSELALIDALARYDREAKDE